MPIHAAKWMKCSAELCNALAQVTWVAMIICILFFEMNLATGACCMPAAVVTLTRNPLEQSAGSLVTTFHNLDGVHMAVLLCWVVLSPQSLPCVTCAVH